MIRFLLEAQNPSISIAALHGHDPTIIIGSQPAKTVLHPLAGDHPFSANARLGYTATTKRGVRAAGNIMHTSMSSLSTAH